MKLLLKKIFSRKAAGVTLSILLLGAGFSTLLPAQIAHAQTAGPTSAAQAPTLEDTVQCVNGINGGVSTDSGATCSRKNADNTTTFCGGPNQYYPNNNTSCTIKYPDGSYTQLQGSPFLFANYDASGKLTGQVNGSITNGNLGLSPTQTGTAANPAYTAPPSNECSLSGLASLAGWENCAMAALAAIALGFASLAGYLLGLVGSIFNWMVVLTIFQFGAYFGNTAGLLTAWGILRDIGNILLLFGFIFMGIIMILDLHTIDTRKAIPALIIVAVLMNFSLFIAEAVIDVTDVLSAAIYTQAGQVACTQSDLSCANTGIAGSILTASGLNNVFTANGGVATALSGIGTDSTHKMIVYIGLSIFMSITMVVLLAATIMLVIRAVVLVFIMVLAPLGFAAMVIPPLSNLGKQWRDILISQAIFAPVYLLLVLVSLKIMTTMQTAFSSNNQGTIVQALSTPSTSYSTIFIFFVLVTGFMIAALMVAKKMGAIGADFATGVAKKTVQRTMTAPARLAGSVAGTYAYAPLVGGTAAWLSKQQTRPGIGGKIARGLNIASSGGLQSGLDSLQKSKPLGGQSYTQRKGLVDHAGHDAEIAKNKSIVLKGVKPGASAEDEAAMRNAFQKLSDADAVTVINSLNQEQAGKIGTFLSTDKFKKILENKDLDHHAKDHLVEGRWKAPREALEEAAKAKASNDPVAEKAAMDKAYAAVKDYTSKELEIMAQNDTNLITDTLNAETADGGSFYKESVLDDFIKSDVPNSSQKAAANSAKRVEKIKDALTGSRTRDAAQLKMLIEKTTAKKFAELSNDLLIRPEISVGMSGEKMAAIMAKEGTLDVQQRNIFLENLDKPGVLTPEQRIDINRHRSSQPAQRFWGPITAPKTADDLVREQQQRNKK